MNIYEQSKITYMNGECKITINNGFATKTQEEIDKILKDIALFYKRKLRVKSIDINH